MRFLVACLSHIALILQKSTKVGKTENVGLLDTSCDFIPCCDLIPARNGTRWFPFLKYMWTCPTQALRAVHFREEGRYNSSPC